MINIDSRLLGEVDANELYLLCYIANRVGKNNNAWPGNETLLKETGWHIEKLIRIKKDLEKRGILKVERHTGRANRYSINSKYITNFIDGKSVNGKSVVVGETDITTTENPALVVDGKSVNDQYGKSDKEVLTIEDVNHNEALTREKAYLSFCVNSLFGCLVKNILTQFENYSHCMAGYREISECEEITDPTIRKSLEKILVAARAIYSAFTELKRPLPEWRETSSMFGPESGDIDPRREAVEQIEAYADYCRITGEYMTATAEKLPEKIVGTDWCQRLRDHADAEIERGKYDPAKDDDLLSQWLRELYYDQFVDVYICKRQENRIVFGGDEYRKVNTYGRPVTNYQKQYINPGKIQ